MQNLDKSDVNSLEFQINSLIQHIQQLKIENHQLRQRISQLQHEHRQLEEKNGLAAEKIHSLIARLKDEII